MKKYKLIIFDCDGTLVDSEALTNRIIATMIKEMGLQISSEDALNRFIGKSLYDIYAYIEGEGLELDRTGFEKDFRARCKVAFEQDLQLIDGVGQLLANINIPMCIGSNGPKVKMKVTLPATGIKQYFPDEVIFSAYDINKWKPEPDLFLLACNKMGVPPGEALVIEDSYSGVMGAVNAGIDVWAYNPHLKGDMYLDQIPNFSSMQDIWTAMEPMI